MTALSMIFFEGWLFWGTLGELLLWVAGVLTFITGYQYFEKSIEYIKSEEEKKSSVKKVEVKAATPVKEKANVSAPAKAPVAKKTPAKKVATKKAPAKSKK